MEITLPKVKRLLLIYPVSLTISPTDLLSLSLSLQLDPRKTLYHTSWRHDHLPRWLFHWLIDVRIEWEREESLFNYDYLTYDSSCLHAELRLSPAGKYILHHQVFNEDPFLTFQRQWRIPDEGFNKSRSCSLYISRSLLWHRTIHVS